MRTKAQVGTEAMIAIGIMLVFFSVLFFVVGQQFVSVSEQRIQQPFIDINERLAREINLAHRSPVGYSRIVEIPGEINNLAYTVSLENPSIVGGEENSPYILLQVSELDAEFTSFLTGSVSGEVCGARLEIRREKNGVSVACMFDLEGESCSANTCHPTLYCDIGGEDICKQLISIGSSCTREDSCVAGAFCDNDVSGNCEALFSAGISCEDNAQCLSGVCDVTCKKSVNEQCTSDDECASNICEGGDK